MWNWLVSFFSSDPGVALVAALLSAIAGAVAGQHPRLSRLLTSLADLIRGTKTSVTVTRVKVGAVLLALVFICGGVCAAPPPVGTAPGADFRWDHLPGIGWGWVQKGITAENFRPACRSCPPMACSATPATVRGPCIGGCIGGQDTCGSYLCPANGVSGGCLCANGTCVPASRPVLTPPSVPSFLPFPGGCPNGRCPTCR